MIFYLDLTILLSLKYNIVQVSSLIFCMFYYYVLLNLKFLKRNIYFLSHLMYHAQLYDPEENLIDNGFEFGHTS